MIPTSYKISDEQTKNFFDFNLPRSNFGSNPFLNPDYEDVMSNFSVDNLLSIEKFDYHDFSMNVDENPSPVLTDFCFESPNEQSIMTDT